MANYLEIPFPRVENPFDGHIHIHKWREDGTGRLYIHGLEEYRQKCGLKYIALASLPSGNPIPVIQNGRFLPHQLKRVRMPLEDLCEQLRGQDVFDATTVHSAFIESSGQLSVYLKPSDGTDTERLLLPVIADGAVVPWAARYCALSDADIARILKTEGVKQKQVLLLLCDALGQHTLLKRRDAE